VARQLTRSKQENNIWLSPTSSAAERPAEGGLSGHSPRDFLDASPRFDLFDKQGKTGREHSFGQSGPRSLAAESLVNELHRPDEIEGQIGAVTGDTRVFLRIWIQMDGDLWNLAF
jgi:hypothetical protein